MAYFLAKTEPSSYSIDDLKRDKKTEWDGVRNPAAVNAIKSMQPGDSVIIYHTGGEKAVVGLAEVISKARPDPKDDRSWVADFKYVQHAKRHVTLKEIKDSHKWDDLPLVRMGRLSTMPVPEAFVKWLRKEGAF
jgi:predicted RNA-binding protein with PUA-like domain